MAFRVILEGADKGAKFDSKDEAIESMWGLYKDKMSRGDYEAFITKHIEEA